MSLQEVDVVHSDRLQAIITTLSLSAQQNVQLFQQKGVVQER